MTFAYAIDEKYFGEPLEMTPEDVATHNARLASMKLKARFIELRELVNEYGSSLVWFPMGDGKPKGKVLDFAA